MPADCWLPRQFGSSDHGEEGVILKKLSGTASIFPDCKFLVVQLLDMDASSAVKRMLFSGGKDQTVVDDGKNDKVRGMNLTFYHSSVQLRTQKLLFDILRVGDKGVNVKVGIFFCRSRIMDGVRQVPTVRVEPSFRVEDCPWFCINSSSC